MTLGFVAATPSDQAAGQLSLSVRDAGGTTAPSDVSFNGVLRLMKPHYLDASGQATYFIVNPGGAYFPETYELDIAVEAGAALVLTTQSATRVHRTTGPACLQNMTIRVDEGARLEYIPDSLIAYHQSIYQQFTTITMAPGGQLFAGEIITPGWHPEGTRFSYTDLHLRTQLRSTDGRRVCIDNLRLTPGETGTGVAGLGQLEGHSHLGSLLIVGSHVDDAYADQVRATVADAPLQVGVTRGERHGIRWLAVRALADSTDALRSAWEAINTLDRARTTGQGPMHLRRY